MEELIPKALGLLRRFQHRSYFPALACVIAAVAGLYIPLPPGIPESILTRGILFLSFGLVGTACGYRLQRPPRNKDGFIGVAFAIKADSEALYERVSSDIVAESKRILEGIQANQPFYVFDLGPDLAESVTSVERAIQLKQRCEAHMLIYGEAKQRRERGQSFYVLQLEGMVTHAPLNVEPRSLLQREMNAVMPLRQRIEQENEISGFEIVSSHLAQSITFVIATAALLSHDGLLAAQLLESIANQRRELNKNAGISAVNKLRKLLPARQRDAHMFMSTVLYAQWEVSRYQTLLRESILWLERDSKYYKKYPTYNYLLVKALSEFVLKSDIRSAMRWLSQCEAKYVTRPEWRYSKAFLCAYQGSTDTAMGYYDSALNLEQNHEVPFQIEGFIAWMLELEPGRKGLYFCLGYINEKFKSDFLAAKANYELFLDGKSPSVSEVRKSFTHASSFLEKYKHKQDLPPDEHAALPILLSS